MAEPEINCNGSPPGSLYYALDPNSPILSQFSDGHKAQILKLSAGTSTLERGPRYNEYSNLRDKKLRMKQLMMFRETPQKQRDQKLQNRTVLTPQKKQVKFNSQANPSFAMPTKRPKESSILTQSVPDFSSILRKENRKPAVVLPPVVERSVTPETGPLKSGRIYSKVGGRSTPPTNSGEKRVGGLIGRKSYASFDELKAASNAITDGENRGGRISRGTRSSVSGYRML